MGKRKSAFEKLEEEAVSLKSTSDLVGRRRSTNDDIVSSDTTKNQPRRRSAVDRLQNHVVNPSTTKRVSKQKQKEEEEEEEEDEDQEDEKESSESESENEKKKHVKSNGKGKTVNKNKTAKSQSSQKLSQSQSASQVVGKSRSGRTIVKKKQFDEDNEDDDNESSVEESDSDYQSESDSDYNPADNDDSDYDPSSQKQKKGNSKSSQVQKKRNSRSPGSTPSKSKKSSTTSTPRSSSSQKQKNSQKKTTPSSSQKKKGGKNSKDASDSDSDDEIIGDLPETKFDKLDVDSILTLNFMTSKKKKYQIAPAETKQEKLKRKQLEIEKNKKIGEELMRELRETYDPKDMEEIERQQLKGLRRKENSDDEGEGEGADGFELTPIKNHHVSFDLKDSENEKSNKSYDVDMSELDESLQSDMSYISPKMKNAIGKKPAVAVEDDSNNSSGSGSVDNNDNGNNNRISVNNSVDYDEFESSIDDIKASLQQESATETHNNEEPIQTSSSLQQSNESQPITAEQQTQQSIDKPNSNCITENIEKENENEKENQSDVVFESKNVDIKQDTPIVDESTIAQKQSSTVAEGTTDDFENSQSTQQDDTRIPSTQVCLNEYKEYVDAIGELYEPMSFEEFKVDMRRKSDLNSQTTV